MAQPRWSAVPYIVRGIYPQAKRQSEVLCTTMYVVVLIFQVISDDNKDKHNINWEKYENM